MMYVLQEGAWPARLNLELQFKDEWSGIQTTVFCGVYQPREEGLTPVCTKESSSGQGFSSRLPWG